MLDVLSYLFRFFVVINNNSLQELKKVITVNTGKRKRKNERRIPPGNILFLASHRTIGLICNAVHNRGPNLTNSKQPQLKLGPHSNGDVECEGMTIVGVDINIDGGKEGISTGIRDAECEDKDIGAVKGLGVN